MRIFQNGYFTIGYTSEDLKKGLRPYSRMQRNNKFLTVCNGAVGRDGVLGTIETPEIVDALTNATYIKDDFPYPQLFILDKHVILCERTQIQELKKGEFTVVIDSLTDSGEKWNVASSYNWIYLSNNLVSIIRDPLTSVYSISSTALVNKAVCNFRGQIIVGVSS